MKVSITQFTSKPAGRTVSKPFQTDGCLLFLMTSRKGVSCPLNLDGEPKEGSMSNFMLHIATPSHTLGNMHPNRIITSRN